VGGRPIRAREGGAWYVAFSPDGQLAGQVGGPWGDEKGVVRVWETATGTEVALLEPEGRPRWGPIVFTGNREILVSNESVLKRWNLDTGDGDVVYDGVPFAIAFSRAGRKVALAEIEHPNDVGAARTIVLDLETGRATQLESRGKGVMKVAFDSSGSVLATCNREGVIHVGPISDEEPHLLLGHEGPIYNLAIDPKGRWIASQGQDRTLRLRPMPDLSKRPLHTLRRSELIAKLKTLTNLRVVRDPNSATGWKLTHDPFPGWETVPTW